MNHSYFQGITHTMSGKKSVIHSSIADNLGKISDKNHQVLNWQSF